MPGTVASDGPTVSLSFANNFWGKEDAGTGPLLDRMANAKLTGDELKAFYTARAQIEEDYAKKLLNLARKPIGSGEEGTLRMSLDVVRGEMESMAKQHQVMAGQMKTELEEPLAAFAGALKERRKIVQNGIEKLLKTKNQQTAVVNRSRDRYEQDCLKIKGYLAQGHMVMGQEERKNKAKLEKTQIQMSSNSNEYEAAVKVLEETTGKWNREWKAACDKFQDLEEERLDFFKSSLWSFANVSSTVCVSDDASCEKIRLSLEDCDVEKDITQFIKDHGTGQEIPDPPKYINFCRGDVEDTASAHESDDGNYSVAQFQRTINPTYRSSSPQPSTFESHNDPESNLREEMGMSQGGRSSLQGDEAFNVNARSSHGSAAPPPLNPSHTSAHSNAPADHPQVPHNPYPVDGMTQFCRIGAPSERSSNPSPTRPESRDSQSEYSNPTSFSSFEPTSGTSSPTKQYNGSGISSASSVGDDRTIQKKKSGFFQSHSPFRRRASQKNKDVPSQSVTTTPTARNTWTPATTRSANTSPTKPQLNAGNRANTWQQQNSPDPEPADPRTDYQLGVGPNVFDVASPDSRKPQASRKDVPPELDPIAQALAELKGVKKQASMRQSADHHYGMSSPAPGAHGRDMPPGAVPTPFAAKGNGRTPPPAYDQPMSRLGAPRPAHTSREMQKTTEQFVNQKRDMFNPSATSRPGSSAGGNGAEMPRSTSPRPFINPDQRQQLPYRAASPNPYGGQPVHRPRAQSISPAKQPQPQQQHQQQPGYNGYGSQRGSPGYQGSRPPSPGYQVPRAASPNPAYNPRPSSSNGGNNANMAMQLAPANGGGQDPYARSQRNGRPQSQYYGNEAPYGANPAPAARTRSQSVGAQRQVTRTGQPILHYARAMYMYQRAIPEELSFAKGDVLAVTRHQDDGWWEAELCGKNEPPGLVPSNYLKNC